MCTASRADSNARFRVISPARKTSAFSMGNTSSTNGQSNLERGSDGFALCNSRIPMEYLLQYFSIGDEALAPCNQPLQDDLRVGLMRVVGAKQIHRDIRIDENQPWYPRSIFTKRPLNFGRGE